MEPIDHHAEHAAVINSFLTSLLLQDKFSDVTFIVCGQKLPAHKNILVANCEYFETMFCSAMKEASQREVVLSAVTSLEAFKAILGYLYAGSMPLEGRSVEFLNSIMMMAHEYRLCKLAEAIFDAILRLSKNDLDQLLILFDYAVLLDLDGNREKCRTLLDAQSRKVLTSDAIMQMTAPSFKELLSSNSFVANEIGIFLAIKKWIDSNPNGDKNLVLSSLRLPLISNANMRKIIKPTGLIDADCFLASYDPFFQPVSMARYHEIYDKNIDTSNFTISRWQTSLTIDLNSWHLVNCIRGVEIVMKGDQLPQFEGTNWYEPKHVGISFDGINYNKVTTAGYFDRKVVRFIKLDIPLYIGTYASHSLECRLAKLTDST